MKKWYPRRCLGILKPPAKPDTSFPATGPGRHCTADHFLIPVTVLNVRPEMLRREPGKSKRITRWSVARACAQGSQVCKLEPKPCSKTRAGALRGPVSTHVQLRARDHHQVGWGSEVVALQTGAVLVRGPEPKRECNQRANCDGTADDQRHGDAAVGALVPAAGQTLQ